VINLNRKCLLIGDEYKRAYSHLIRADKETIFDQGPGFPISGHPDICRCFSLIFIPVTYALIDRRKVNVPCYILIRRCLDGLPTAIQFNNDSIFILIEEGKSPRQLRLSTHPTDTMGSLMRHVWALTDFNQFIMTPCAAFTKSAAMIVQAASPKEQRTKSWHKYHYGQHYVMQPVRWSELTFVR
jgi:hypothetical protein